MSSEAPARLPEYGSFEAEFDKVFAFRKAIFGALKELFDLPLETKKLYVSDNHFSGYYGPKAPLCESLIIDESNIAESIERRLTNILWPQGNTSFSKTLLSFSELALGLEKTIRRMVLESFGMEKYMDELMDSTNYILRVMKYEEPQTREPVLGPRAHFDQNMVTLLYQNELWLNGRLWPPYHHVIMTRNKTRYCVGLFATPRGGNKVKAPDELVDEDNPMLFKPFDYEEFLGFYSNEVARGAVASGLKVYCSV
ncbi:hypothetical protein REPUB_Repub14bG0038200 [Reevesia pubescens]